MILQGCKQLDGDSTFQQALLSAANYSSCLVERCCRRDDERYAFLWLPETYHERHDETEVYTILRTYRPDILLIIGIGGSSMGCQAIYGMLKHTLPVDGPELWFATTIDAITTATISAQLETALRAGKRVALIIISKSGTTIETIANGAIYLDLLNRYAAPIAGQITVITEPNSSLWHHAQHARWLRLAVPQQLGGRFSVWSAAATLPLSLVGIPVKRLLAGAATIQDRLSAAPTRGDHPAVYLATMRYYYYMQGLIVHDSVLSAPHLSGYGYWLRQLLGESLGKYRSTKTTLDTVGFLPTVSILTDDLHSVFQRYMAGPRCIVTTFIQDRAEDRPITIPVTPLTADTPYQRLSAQGISQTIFTAVEQAYQNAALPYATVAIDTNSIETIGMLMHTELIATIILGEYWLAIDPFGQPEIEQYKSIFKDLITASSTASD